MVQGNINSKASPMIKSAKMLQMPLSNQETTIEWYTIEFIIAKTTYVYV